MSVAKMNFVKVPGGKSILMKEFTGYIPRIGESVAIVTKKAGEPEVVVYYRVLDTVHTYRDDKCMTSDITIVVEELPCYIIPTANYTAKDAIAAATTSSTVEALAKSSLKAFGMFTPTLPAGFTTWEELRQKNNSENFPVVEGNNTRCIHCHSTDVWGDEEFSRCNCCGALVHQKA